MQCSQCQTELPDSATICPRCGTANEQPNQPVMFSYLPAGTPPWPITVPQRPSYASAPAAPASFSKSQETKPRRSLRSILLAVAVLVLVPIFGVAFTLTNLYFNGDLFPRHAAAHKVQTSQAPAQSTPQVTASATAQSNVLPAPAAFKKTSNTDVNMSLKYPSDWQLQPSNDTNSHSIGLTPSQQIPIKIIIARFSDSFSASITSPDEVNQGITSEVEQGTTNVQTIKPANPQPTIGGVQWQQTEGAYTDSNGNRVHIASITVQRNKIYYNILVLSLDQVYTEATQKYIQPILNSVQFLS